MIWLNQNTVHCLMGIMNLIDLGLKIGVTIMALGLVVGVFYEPMLGIGAALCGVGLLVWLVCMVLSLWVEL